MSRKYRKEIEEMKNESVGLSSSEQQQQWRWRRRRLSDTENTFQTERESRGGRGHHCEQLLLPVANHSPGDVMVISIMGGVGGGPET